MRLGFGAVWDRPPEPTWSYIPWSLRAALREQADIADVGLDLEPWKVTALKAMHVRRLQRSQRSGWRFSAMLFDLARRTFERNASRLGCDAVLQTTPIAAVRNVPYFVYLDAGIDALHQHRDPVTGEYPYFPGLPPKTTDRLGEHQRRVLQEAAGVFGMSEWVAASLTSRTGLDPAKVHVVYPGRNVDGLDVEPVGSNPRTRPGTRRTRLLFVGKAFRAKGADLVVDAVSRLRRDYDPNTTLTIAGPAAPPPGGLPDGVQFLGRVPLTAVADLYREHDLFVMPSRIEPFGIVFVEALAQGLPCIGRDAFAMPSMIRPGDNGDLIADDDPDALATTIARVLTDDAIYRRCDEQRAAVIEYYSWTRAAREMLEVVAEHAGSGPAAAGNTGG